MKYLLDVNVLLAAIWSTHSHHEVTSAWLADKNVVLCPIAELGFIRISTNKKASLGMPMQDCRVALQKFAVAAEKIPDDLHALDSHPRASEDVTDHYLADLAAKHGLKLATLDGQIKHPSVELVS